MSRTCAQMRRMRSRQRLRGRAGRSSAAPTAAASSCARGRTWRRRSSPCACPRARRWRSWSSWASACTSAGPAARARTRAGSASASRARTSSSGWMASARLRLPAPVLALAQGLAGAGLTWTARQLGPGLRTETRSRQCCLTASMGLPRRAACCTRPAGWRQRSAPGGSPGPAAAAPRRGGWAACPRGASSAAWPSPRPAVSWRPSLRIHRRRRAACATRLTSSSV
mmetsp:Transcript_68353/g.199978  ORF Transcript_68353/g.199978 Transcript_68353/m.199978 type:complete len:226 (-) Transcript_68353:850-1527(-)